MPLRPHPRRAFCIRLAIAVRRLDLSHLPVKLSQPRRDDRVNTVFLHTEGEDDAYGIAEQLADVNLKKKFCVALIDLISWKLQYCQPERSVH